MNFHLSCIYFFVRGFFCPVDPDVFPSVQSGEVGRKVKEVKVDKYKVLIIYLLLYSFIKY